MAATLKCDTIQNASSATANITLDTAGNATVGNTLAMGSSFLRNRIINGAMVIDQRNAGASVTPSTSGTYTVDRWTTYFSQASKFSVQQNAGSVTPPAGFSKYLGFTSLAATSLGATDYFNFAQTIEGFNCADLAWGTANAKTITISFWAYSSLTGTFGGVIQNQAGARFYPFSYTISSANTWEYKTLTVAGDTGGTWPADNTGSIQIRFSIGTGSTYSGTAGSWGATTYASVTGATSVVGTNGATFYITGVQLEVGSVATPFERRQYGQELALCYRYYQVMDGFEGVAASATQFAAILSYSVPMRASPSVGQTAVLAVTSYQADFTQSSAQIAINSSRVTSTGIQIYANNFSGMTQYGFLGTKPSVTGYVTLSAEL